MTEEVEVITAVATPPEDVSKVGSEEFVRRLLKELHGKPVWRKLDSLADSLHVDIHRLRDWLEAAPGFLKKSGKDDGVFYYCWQERYERVLRKDKQETPRLRPGVREEDRYALSMLHLIYWNLHWALKTYGLEINQRDRESFNFFALALDKLESGLCLFSKKSGAAVEKLPKFF